MSADRESGADVMRQAREEERAWQEGRWVAPPRGWTDAYVLVGHEPVRAPLLVAGRWFEDVENRRVALTHLAGGAVRVSTVFIVFDHSLTLQGPPLLFETMSFQDAPLTRWEGEMLRVCSLRQEQERYATWDEAAAGHERMVEEVQRKLRDAGFEDSEIAPEIAPEIPGDRERQG